jgi:hypothetical protein
MARKRSFRFGLPIVVAGRPSVGGVGLGCQLIRFAAAATSGSFKRPDHATLHGVVLDIFVERPIHGSETTLGAKMVG